MPWAEAIRKETELTSPPISRAITDFSNVSARKKKMRRPYSLSFQDEFILTLSASDRKMIAGDVEEIRVAYPKINIQNLNKELIECEKRSCDDDGDIFLQEEELVAQSKILTSAQQDGNVELAECEERSYGDDGDRRLQEQEHAAEDQSVATVHQDGFKLNADIADDECKIVILRAEDTNCVGPHGLNSELETSSLTEGEDEKASELENPGQPIEKNKKRRKKKNYDGIRRCSIRLQQIEERRNEEVEMNQMKTSVVSIMPRDHEIANDEEEMSVHCKDTQQIQEKEQAAERYSTKEVVEVDTEGHVDVNTTNNLDSPVVNRIIVTLAESRQREIVMEFDEMDEDESDSERIRAEVNRIISALESSDEEMKERGRSREMHEIMEIVDEVDEHGISNEQDNLASGHEDESPVAVVTNIQDSNASTTKDVQVLKSVAQHDQFSNVISARDKAAQASQQTTQTSEKSSKRKKRAKEDGIRRRSTRLQQKNEGTKTDDKENISQQKQSEDNGVSIEMEVQCVSGDDADGNLVEKSEEIDQLKQNERLVKKSKEMAQIVENGSNKLKAVTTIDLTEPDEDVCPPNSEMQTAPVKNKSATVSRKTKKSNGDSIKRRSLRLQKIQQENQNSEGNQKQETDKTTSDRSNNHIQSKMNPVVVVTDFLKDSQYDISTLPTVHVKTAKQCQSPNSSDKKTVSWADFLGSALATFVPSPTVFSPDDGDGNVKKQGRGRKRSSTTRASSTTRPPKGKKRKKKTVTPSDDEDDDVPVAEVQEREEEKSGDGREKSKKFLGAHCSIAGERNMFTQL